MADGPRGLNNAGRVLQDPINDDRGILNLRFFAEIVSFFKPLPAIAWMVAENIGFNSFISNALRLMIRVFYSGSGSHILKRPGLKVSTWRRIRDCAGMSRLFFLAASIYLPEDPFLI